MAIEVINVGLPFPMPRAGIFVASVPLNAAYVFVICVAYAVLTRSCQIIRDVDMVLWARVMATMIGCSATTWQVLHVIAFCKQTCVCLEVLLGDPGHTVSFNTFAAADRVTEVVLAIGLGLTTSLSIFCCTCRVLAE